MNQESRIKKAVKTLRLGGVIVYPTETAYALGGAATKETAVRKIFQIKGRAKNKTLPLIIGSLALAKQWFIFNRQELALAKKYWPGPLTLVLSVRHNLSKSDFDKLSKEVVAKDGTAAVRVSGNVLARRLSLALGEPLVSTSANLAGHGEGFSLAAVIQQLEKKIKLVDLVINGGHLPKTPPSTIVRVRKGKVIVLRQGSVVL